MKHSLHCVWKERNWEKWMKEIWKDGVSLVWIIKKKGVGFGEKFGGKTWTNFVQNTIFSKMERFKGKTFIFLLFPFPSFLNKQGTSPSLPFLSFPSFRFPPFFTLPPKKKNEYLPSKPFYFRRYYILNKICPCFPSKPLASKSLPSLCYPNKGSSILQISSIPFPPFLSIQTQW